MSELEPQAAPPSTTTVPSDDQPKAPEASSKPDVAPKSIPKATLLQKLRFIVLRLIQRLAYSTDRSLVRISELLSTPGGIDSLLCTISYTLTLLHALLSQVLEKRLASIATNIAEKAETVLFPGETLIATLPAPQSTKILAQIVGSSKALSGTIADYRIFVRLWGLAGIYTWAKATWNTPLAANAGRKEKFLRSVEWGEIVTSVAFQILENGAYLSSKGALTSASWTGDAGKRKENLWWVWSSKFWAAQVSLELVRLFVAWLHLDAKARVDDQDGEKEGKIQREELERQWQVERQLWWRDLVNNVAYFPMTLHWSTETGILSEAVVGLCGMFAGGVMLRHRWKATA